MVGDNSVTDADVEADAEGIITPGVMNYCQSGRTDGMCYELFSLLTVRYDMTGSQEA